MLCKIKFILYVLILGKKCFLEGICMKKAKIKNVYMLTCLILFKSTCIGFDISINQFDLNLISI